MTKTPVNTKLKWLQRNTIKQFLSDWVWRDGWGRTKADKAYDVIAADAAALVMKEIMDSADWSVGIGGRLRRAAVTFYPFGSLDAPYADVEFRRLFERVIEKIEDDDIYDEVNLVEFVVMLRRYADKIEKATGKAFGERYLRSG